MSALKRPGVGNPAMGTVFKSIYLCQGRGTSSQNSKQLTLKKIFFVENPELKEVRNILLNLMERPEE